MDFIESYKQEAKKIVEHLKQDLSSLRAGSASPSMVESILVSAYGVKTPLKQLASITMPEPRTIVIQPWDPGILKDVEKSIQESNLGLTPNAQEKLLRLTIPPLTEEKRREITKLLNKKLENARIHIRNVRDNVRDEIRGQEQNKEITEDDKYRLWENLDKETAKVNDEVKKIGETKKKEIMTI